MWQSASNLHHTHVNSSDSTSFTYWVSGLNPGTAALNGGPDGSRTHIATLKRRASEPFELPTHYGASGGS